MNEPWNILLVDDEPDVHEVTRLALKHKRWRKRPFALTSLTSMKEAVKMFEGRECPDFQVAIIDVVMESEDAGLRLCEYVRSHRPASLRIVLRTGQPGVAPEEHVLNEYDIDYYLAKPEATPDKLYSVVRACLRSSQDISTLLAFGRQLQNFTRALQNVSSVADLLVFMAEALQFLELKHSAATVLNYDLSANDGSIYMTTRSTGKPVDQITAAMRQAYATNDLMKPHEGSRYGLPAHSFLIPFHSRGQSKADGGPTEGSGDEPGEIVPGALYMEITPELATEKTKRDLAADASLFIDNWRIAYATLRLQERYARERMLREKMYFERVQGIATMVTGVAHELNTPLGVANTANSMVTGLAKTLMQLPPGSPDTKEVVKDLDETCGLLTKNLARAQTLIKSFKQLSASQLSDQKGECDIAEVVRDCVESMTPEVKKHQIAVKVTAPTDKRLSWNGYPSHLSQVVMNMIQNVIRYAYPNGGGTMDIRVHELATGFRVEFEDYGAGVSAEVLNNIFEPFVTSARGKGGTGLGLAIVHNIVTNLLDGTIKVTTTKGSGTKFTVEVPREVKEKTGDAAARAASLGASR
jgi:signal transduction histidine kinase/CheY-like chemotaxis protein